MSESSPLIPAWVDGQLRPMDKLAVHRQGLRHPAVSVFVFCDGALLIQQRAASKYHTAGKWANTCCTHAHWGEDPAACAQRRLAEELGLRGVDLQPRGQIEYRADVGGGMIEHEVVDLFLGVAASVPDLALNPDEVQATRWVSVADLQKDMAHDPDRFTPWLQVYLRDHAAKVLPS